MKKFSCFIIFLISLSCTPEKRTEINEKELKYADSLYSIQFDSLRKKTDLICDSIYGVYLQNSIDSIKIIRTKEIEELFK